MRRVQLIPSGDVAIILKSEAIKIINKPGVEWPWRWEKASTDFLLNLQSKQIVMQKIH